MLIFLSYLYYSFLIDLQVEFNKFYVDATVKWVFCPDLTQAPFYFMAPGNTHVFLIFYTVKLNHPLIYRIMW